MPERKKFFLLVKEISIRYEQVVEAESDDEAFEMFDDQLLKEVGQAKNFLDPMPCREDGSLLEDGDEDEDGDEGEE